MPKTSQRRPTQRRSSHPVRNLRQTPTLPEDRSRASRMRHPAARSRAAERIARHRAKKKERQRRRLTASLLLLLVLAIIAAVTIPTLRTANSDVPDMSTGDDLTASPSTRDPTGKDPETNLPVSVPLPKDTVICLDPGHGYGDPGTGSDYLLPYYEKDINLAIANKLRDILLSEGYRVRMTRDSDTPPGGQAADSLLTPEERVAMLRGMGDVDYFLSIHCNSYVGDAHVSGPRIYYYTGNSDQTPALAQSVADAIRSGLGIVSAPSVTSYSSAAFAVTKHTVCPALLIEVGFVTDPVDAKNMTVDAWQTQMARSIANGLTAHILANKTTETKGIASYE